MKKLKVKLENCYGIKKLGHSFDFSKHKTYSIYASNGVMKTSFTKTFLRLSEGKMPEELIHGYPSEYEVKIDGQTIEKEAIFVIKSYIKSYQSGNIHTLLVDGKSQKEYYDIYSAILEEKNKLLPRINKLSGVKKDEIEPKVIRDFQKENFFDILKGLEVDSIKEDFSGIKYDVIFNDDSIKFLESPEVLKNIKEYIKISDKIISNSKFFKKGTFTSMNADNVATALKKENFFSAKHAVKIDGQAELIESDKDLAARIATERKEILTSPELKKIEDAITAKAANRSFKIFLEENPGILSYLEADRLGELRKNLWKSYFKKEKALYMELMDKYTKGKKKLNEIEEKAVQQMSIWDEVVKKFKKRFFVPFNISIENRRSAIIGRELPNISFHFDDGNSKPRSLKRNELDSLEALSHGEEKALYILNIIFEIESRKRAGQKTLLVIDDIADSFDYKNKYAIVEYLKENSKEKDFFQIILTHNFDFFRTLRSRIDGEWENYLIAHKTSTGILLESIVGKNIIDPFAAWKLKLKGNGKEFIASVPFIRNLIEYLGEGSGENRYEKLTSLLHIKKGIPDIEVQELHDIFNNTLNPKVQFQKIGRQPVKKLIYDLADSIEKDNSETINLENKIILSIAIRLVAEEFMWAKVTDSTPINGSQTGLLFDRFLKDFETKKEEKGNIEVLSKVVLITPENIHLNSFMYEPILDMSDFELKQLYSEVKILK